MLSGDYNLENLIEQSFYMTYFTHMQPSEVSSLSTYEFRMYLDLMNKQVKEDREYEQTIAKVYGAGALLR